jgi:DNA mismatch repair protein MutL
VHIPQTRPLRDDYNPFANTGSSHKKVLSDWGKMYEEVGGAEKSNGTEASVNSMPSEQDPSNGILDLKGTDRSVQHYQYRGQYIVTEVRSGLMFIDQHLAHARVLYNRYRKQLAEHQAPSQGLLFPELLQLPPSDVPLVESIMDDLTSLGFDISSLGGGNYSIQGAPAGFDGIEPRQLLVDIIDDLRQKGQDLEEGMHHRMAMTMARNAAIPIGNVLTEQEMESLVDELFQQEQPNYAPDGRRIIAICPHEMLEKLFK